MTTFQNGHGLMIVNEVGSSRRVSPVPAHVFDVLFFGSSLPASISILCCCFFIILCQYRVKREAALLSQVGVATSGWNTSPLKRSSGRALPSKSSTRLASAEALSTTLLESLTLKRRLASAEASTLLSLSTAARTLPAAISRERLGSKFAGQQERAQSDALKKTPVAARMQQAGRGRFIAQLLIWCHFKNHGRSTRT